MQVSFEGFNLKILKYLKCLINSNKNNCIVVIAKRIVSNNRF